MIYINCDNLNAKIVIPSPVKKGGVDNFILTGADGSLVTAECTDVSDAPFTYELVPKDGAGFDFSGVQPGEYNMTLRFGRTKLADLLVSLRTVSDVDIYYDEEKEVTRIPDYFIPYDNITGKPTFKTINGERIDNGPGNIVTAGADMEVVTIDKTITAQELIDAGWGDYIITLPELEASKYYVLNLTYPIKDENGDPIRSTINIEYKGIKTGASILEINQTREGYGTSEINVKFQNRDPYNDQPKFYNCTNSTHLQQPDYDPALDIFNIGYGVVTRIPSNADTIEGLTSKLDILQSNIDRKAEFRKIFTSTAQQINFNFAHSEITYYSNPITQEEHNFRLPYGLKDLYARFVFTAGPDLVNLHFVNADNSIDKNVATTPNTQYFAEFYFSYNTYTGVHNLQTTTLIPIGSASSGGGGGLTPEQVQQIIDQNTAGFETISEVDRKLEAVATPRNLKAVDQTELTNVEIPIAGVTEERVNQLIDDRGYTTMTDVEQKDYATNTRVNEVEGKIPTDNAALTNGAGYETANEVDRKLQDYTPTANIKTVNGQSLTDGPGNIEISGGASNKWKDTQASSDGNYLYISPDEKDANYRVSWIQEEGNQYGEYMRMYLYNDISGKIYFEVPTDLVNVQRIGIPNNMGSTPLTIVGREYIYPGEKVIITVDNNLCYVDNDSEGVTEERVSQMINEQPGEIWGFELEDGSIVQKYIVTKQ